MEVDSPGLWATFKRHRARIGQTVFVLGLIGLFFQLAPHVPRDMQLDLRLGDAHADVVALQVELVHRDEVLRSVELRYPQGAPRVVERDARLPVGEIELRALLTLRDGHVVHVERRFSSPADGPLRIDLAP